jgi:AraC-like DNA-binding protein
MEPNVVFSEYQPAPALSPFIQTYWFGDFNVAGDADYAQSVVPNGCIELIIHLTQDCCLLNSGNGTWNQTAPFIVVGMFTKSYVVRFSSRVDVFGIRFHPDGFRNTFGISPIEFLSAYEDGVDVLGDRIREFCQQIQESHSKGHRIRLANEFLLTQLKENFLAHDYTHLAMRLIRQAAGTASYNKLVAQVPISERQLQRTFRQQYGITMMDYLRLARMNATYAYLQAGEHLTQLAGDLEFFDQSHFIREFKSHVGLAPGKFIRQRNEFIVNPALDKASIPVL